jgi:hypothetical protein
LKTFAKAELPKFIDDFAKHRRVSFAHVVINHCCSLHLVFTRTKKTAPKGCFFWK